MTVSVTCVEFVVVLGSVPVPMMVMVYCPAGVPADCVVTCKGELCTDVPALSVAATVKLYVVEGNRPVTLKLVVVLVPIEVPF